METGDKKKSIANKNFKWDVNGKNYVGGFIATRSIFRPLFFVKDLIFRKSILQIGFRQIVITSKDFISYFRPKGTHRIKGIQAYKRFI